MANHRYVVPAVGVAVALIAAGISPGLSAHATTSAHPAGGTPSSMAYGSIVVATGSSVLVFSPTANGNVAPIRTIKGAATNLNNAYTVDLDGAGNIWTANFNGGLIQKFSGVANGNVGSTNSLSENNNNDELPLGVAVSNDNKQVWIANDGSSILAAYSTSDSGTTAAAQRIAGPDTGIGFSRDVTFSTNGKQLYESDGGNADVHEYLASGPEDQAPIRTIDVGDPSAHQVQGIAVDSAGNVWVADNQNGAIYEYGKNSDTVPIRTITGSNAGLANPGGITIDALGNLWVANEGINPSVPANVEAFAPNSNGNAAPIITLAGAKTGLSYASDVVVYGGTPGKPTGASVSGGKSGFHVTWKAPSTTGGGLIGYVVERKVSKHAKWKVIATTHKPHYTDAFGGPRPKPGHIYRYAAIAYNEFGASGRSKAAKGKAK